MSWGEDEGNHTERGIRVLLRGYVRRAAGKKVKAWPSRVECQRGIWGGKRGVCSEPWESPDGRSSDLLSSIWVLGEVRSGWR